MTQVPRAALFLGLAGLIPFLFGAGLSLMPEPDLPPGQFAWIYPSDAPAILAGYGIVILCFMAGVLWGFAARAAEGPLWLYLSLSVAPALFAFFAASQHLFSLAPSNLDALRNLAIGFAGLLMIDWFFAQRALVPAWWMKLRVLLTVIVVVCLVIGYVNG